MKQQMPEQLGELFEDVKEKSGAEKVITIKSPADNHERTVVPQLLWSKLMKWHHTVLVHPGVERLHNTLHQHCTWPAMRKDICEHIKPCHECQIGKRGGRGFGKLSMKDRESQPWDNVCVDLAGNFTL